MSCKVFEVIVEQLIPSGKYQIKELANIFIENMLRLQDICPEVILNYLNILKETSPQVWVEIMVRIGNGVNEVSEM